MNTVPLTDCNCLIIAQSLCFSTVSMTLDSEHVSASPESLLVMATEGSFTHSLIYSMSIYQVSVQCLLIVSHTWAFRHEAGPALPSHCPHWCVLSGQIQALGFSVMTRPVSSLACC